MSEEFEDTKEVIRIYKSKDRQYNSKNKKDKTLTISLIIISGQLTKINLGK